MATQLLLRQRTQPYGGRGLLYSHVLYRNDTIIKNHVGITDVMMKTQWITDARRKTQEDFFNKIYIPLTLFVRVQKGYSRFACERELETEHNRNILTPKLWPSALCLSRSPGLLNRSPGVHSAGCWLPSLQTRLTPSPTLLNCPSVQFVGLILPSNSHAVIWTRLHASAISSDIWRSGCVTSAIFGKICVIVIKRK